MKKIKKRMLLIIILVLVVSFFFQEIKSYTCMYFYSMNQKNKSVLKDEKIELQIPGGLRTFEKDWYPLMMVFNADKSFSNYIGKETRLTILYTFGAFEHFKGASSFYNDSSKYYSSFYGAYIIKQDDRCYGFEQDGLINIDELVLVPKFDYEELVLKDFGCENPDTKFSITKIKENISYAGLDDWTLVEADIITNSPIHKVSVDKRSYIQYGKPPEVYYKGEDFPKIELKGRMYIKNLKNKNMTICLYIICNSTETLNECDNKLLSKSKVKLPY